MDGEGSYSNLVQDLGVTSLRYPGGSLTEEFFDLSDPDATTATHRDTGDTVDFIPISDFMDSAAALGSPVTIVLPTRNQLSQGKDGNGDRFADVDEAVLRGFVRDVVTGKYGDAEIEAFEIGNEYWGSGKMSSQEYGRVAAEMSRIISSELDKVEANHGTGGDTDVVVQMGTNFNYASLDEEYKGWNGDAIVRDLETRYDIKLEDDVARASGHVDWTEVGNAIIAGNFDDGNIGDIDGIVAHVYSKEPAAPGQRSFMLDQIDDAWHEEFEDLDTYITEWNMSGSSGHFDREEDYGLYQAHEMLNMIEQFVDSGVDVAHAWPLLQNTANTFSRGFDHEELTPAGEFYKIMADTLPGKQMIDLDPHSDETETQIGKLTAHAFYGDGDLVLFLVAPRGGAPKTEVDLSELIRGFGHFDAQKLGVAQGDHPGSNLSDAVVDVVPKGQIYADGSITADLSAGEILTVTLSDINPSATLTEHLGSVSAKDAPETKDPILDAAPAPAPPPTPTPTPPPTSTRDEPEPDPDPDTTSTGSDPLPTQKDGSSADPSTTQGSTAADRLTGTNENDKLKGYAGDDTIAAGNGDDTVNGGRGDDRLSGNDGDDNLRGREGNDLLSGGNGDDVLFGERGADVLKGGKGQDSLYGGDGDDTLHGGQKGDWLEAGAGKNVVSGGFGRDIFAFDDSDRAFLTRITDFTPGRDQLWFDEDLLDDLDDITFLHDAKEKQLTLVLDDRTDQKVVLEGIAEDDLDLQSDLLIH